MLNNLSTISNCGVQQEEEISFMIQFLIFGGGKGWGCARLEQKVLTEKLFLSELFNNLFYISLNVNFVYVVVLFLL